MTRSQGSLSFEDVAVVFTWEEWQLLDSAQKSVDRSVVLENWSSLVSLGFQVIKPDVIFKLEEEQQWIIDEDITGQRFSGPGEEGCLMECSLRVLTWLIGSLPCGTELTPQQQTDFPPEGLSQFSLQYTQLVQVIYFSL
ncbi:zinc finger protein 613-like isoform X4 [Equus quagga]|nr:zinc finger protein 613-like isoform X3 [Equus quagga]XP_046495087.1 zinc finger protein 613-like isoform X4 [Equus quagga]XP_046495088.1 zinc finger protein 613-like isoform X4 [Equus quagga]